VTQPALTWLAYSDKEQQRAQDLASSLSERETRDELGVGSIRDALADRLFPGTSTIQSRARYFLFLPWVFQSLERDQKGRARERAERAERALIASLRASADIRGLVGGRTALVARLPSSVYWNGLAVLGIRRVAGPLAAYYRWLDNPRRRARIDHDDDGFPVEGVVRTWWDRVPAGPSGFPEVAEFALRGVESAYLAGRATAATPHPNALAFLFREGDANAVAPFPWEHPQAEAMPASVRDDLEVAGQFSLIHHGAALLYNEMIAEARDDHSRAEEYRLQVDDWQDKSASALDEFDLRRVWILAPRASIRAKRFIEQWRTVCLKANGHLSDDTSARNLVRSREIRVKGKVRSRIESPFRVEWNGASGSARLDYRWGDSVQQIARDVAEGRSRA
jgi:hypothetical protein